MARSFHLLTGDGALVAPVGWLSGRWKRNGSRRPVSAHLAKCRATYSRSMAVEDAADFCLAGALRVGALFCGAGAEAAGWDWDGAGAAGWGGGVRGPPRAQRRSCCPDPPTPATPTNPRPPGRPPRLP